MKSEKSNLIDMNKSDLKKLSKSELIKLLLKQEKKKPEIIVVDDTKYPKPIDKPKKKQKKAYNHDNLFNDNQFPDFVVTSDPFERTMIKVNNKKRDVDEQTFNINSKYQNLMSKTNQSVNDTKNTQKCTQKIRDYPMIKVKLDDFRRSEIKLSMDKNRAKVSFIELFETRLNKIPGKREIVSISLDVEINHTMTSDAVEYIQNGIEQYERQPKYMRKKNGIDEFNIKYKKVIKQTFYNGNAGNMGNNYIRKSYGPFTVEKPVNLSKHDIYKFAMYILLKNKFTILSQEVISGIAGFHCHAIKIKIENHSMNEVKKFTRYRR